MSDIIYDKPNGSTDPFKSVNKEVIQDRNELVLQQYLERRQKRENGEFDQIDVLLDNTITPLVDEYPELIVSKTKSITPDFEIHEDET